MLAALATPVVAAAQRLDVQGPVALSGHGLLRGELQATAAARPVRIRFQAGRVRLVDLAGDLKVRCKGRPARSRQNADGQTVYQCAGRSRLKAAPNGEGAAVSLGAMPLLRLPEPYDFQISTERFRSFGPDLANLWHEGALHRVVGKREVRIEEARGGVRVEPLDAEIRSVVRKLLGADLELEPFYAWARRDPVLKRLTRLLAGFRPPLAPDPFETLVTSITAQQVSLHAAFAIRNRLIQRFGRRAGEAYSFPTAQRLRRASAEELLALGFSGRKAEYVLGLASEPIDFTALADLPDDEIKARLVAVRGLGEWTADWFLARHLARPRAWPAGDLGLRKAVLAYYPDAGDVRAFGERFEPFQNLSAHYLLTGLRVAPS
jgi:3-methyladenine DNA glycosylase/8-oxoguanine DNA glycosylase